MLTYGMTQTVAPASTTRAGVTRYANKQEASIGVSIDSALTPSSMYSVFRDAMAFYKEVHHSVFAENLDGQSVSVTLPNDAFSVELYAKWSGDDAVTATAHIYREDGVTMEQSEIELRNGERVVQNLGRQAETVTISLPPTPNSDSGVFQVSNAMTYRGYRKSLIRDAQLFKLIAGANNAAGGFMDNQFGEITPRETIEGYEWARLTSLSGVVRVGFYGDVSLNGRELILWINGVSCDLKLEIDGGAYMAVTYDPNIAAMLEYVDGEEFDVQVLFL